MENLLQKIYGAKIAQLIELEVNSSSFKRYTELRKDIADILISLSSTKLDQKTIFEMKSLYEEESKRFIIRSQSKH